MKKYFRFELQNQTSNRKWSRCGVSVSQNEAAAIAELRDQLSRLRWYGEIPALRIVRCRCEVLEVKP